MDASSSSPEALGMPTGVLRAVVERGPRGWVLLVDSITQVTPADSGAIVVAGSHGGASSASYALAVPLAAAFFNDAGVGKDRAGIAALDMLQARGVAAGAVAHTSARIGDARDMWEHGVLTQVNAAARALGLAAGMPLQRALRDLLTPVPRT
jgi:hypothetical protein